MPIPPIDPQIESASERVDSRLQGAQGIALRGTLTDSSAKLLAMHQGFAADSLAAGKAGAVTTDWLRQIPETLAASGKKDLLKFKDVPEAESAKAVAHGFDVLQAGLLGLIFSDEPVTDVDIARLVQLGFGNGKLVKTLRDRLVKPFEPDIDFPKLPGLVDLSDILAAGNFRDRLKTLVDCGKIARTRLQFAAQPFGRISKIEPNTACAGDSVRISFAGLGANPPDGGWELYLSLPRSDESYGSLRLLDLDPQIQTPARWKDNGYIDIVLPQDIGSGFVGFYLVPPPPDCNEQSYLSSALLVANDIAATDPRGSAAATPLLTFAINIAEYMRAGPTKLIPRQQADGKNTLTAGRPVVEFFEIIGGDPVFPGETITIAWKVRNATHVALSINTLPGSENLHELDSVSLPDNRMEGRQDFHVTCTRNWNALCTLRASNGAQCGAAEASRTVTSGFRHYRLGVAKEQFRFNVQEWDLRMLGFADEKQLCNGELDDIFTRAFIVAEHGGPGLVAIAVMDLWGCSQPVKSAVAARLAADPDLASAGFSEANLMICGTHTHSAPGGYFHDYMYNLTLEGFNQNVFDHVVDVASSAIKSAYQNMKPGRLLFGQGTVAGCGANRSIQAFRANPEAAHVSETDESMLLLKFMHGSGKPNEVERSVGCLNWFAMHPTSLGFRNDLISGDNKGWAAHRFESAHCPANGQGFVAGFANAACGDTSGNVKWLNGVIERETTNGTTHAKFLPPLGKVSDGGVFLSNQAAMKKIGEIQFNAAQSIFSSPGLTEVSGKLDSRLRHLQISNVSDDQGNRLTFEGAMGTSFGAGSMEDGEAYVYFGPVPVNSGIVEGITRAKFDAAGLTAAGKAGGFAAILSLAYTVLGPLATSLVKLILGGGGLAATLALMNDEEKSWFMTCMGYFALAAFRLSGHEFDGRNSGFTFNAALPAVLGLPESFKQAHYPKPIIFACGLAKTDKLGKPPQPCPLIPDIVPIQLLRIGKMVIAGIPGEITNVAGIRLRRSIMSDFAVSGSVVALSTYANHYSGYITTREEYDMQHYEGASTLYGPGTLQAYQQEYSKLAAALRTGTPVDPGSPEVKPGVHMKKVKGQ